MDLEHHSKVPIFLRMHGSIMPRMIFPFTFIAAWSSLITLISHFWKPLVVNSVLLTVLGFVVGLGISFRTSSAYERYVDGRRFWAQLSQASRDLARHIWIHVEERHSPDPEVGKADLLDKISALNLVAAFAVALKHRLRFEPYADYDDLAPLIPHLTTFATEAANPIAGQGGAPRKTPWKRGGEYLGLSFAESDPRKQLKRATRNLGHLPLEILTHLSAYVVVITRNKTLATGSEQSILLANLASLNEVLAGTERVLNTPLPAAYSIAINQITWVYVLMLPFQLWGTLHWVTIPATLVASYIILGIAAIGKEIENPFGQDVNDLPLDKYCKGLQDEINVVMARPAPDVETLFRGEGNGVLLGAGWQQWVQGDTDRIREGLRAKAERASEGDGNEVLHLRLREKIKKGRGGGEEEV